MKLILFANIRRWVRWGAFQQPKARQHLRFVGGCLVTSWE